VKLFQPHVIANALTLARDDALKNVVYLLFVSNFDSILAEYAT